LRYTSSSAANPESGPKGDWEYPTASQGKPVNIQPRTHSVSAHAAGKTMVNRSSGVAGMRAKSQPATAGSNAKQEQKIEVATTATGQGMPPKSCMLT
jgi:hypothetical protein